MTADVDVTSEIGIVGFWDAGAPPPVAPKVTNCVELLRQHARKGNLFFVQDDDSVRYRIRVYIDEELPESVSADYENSSGSFKLALPSGEMFVGGIELKGPAASAPLSVIPGEYVLTVFSALEFDAKRYRTEMEELFGADDWKFRQRIDRIGAAGCLTTMLAVLLIVIPATRGLWWISLALMTPCLLHLLLTQLPRYRKMQKVMREQKNILPHLIIALKRSAVATELQGGWIHNS